ncbi:transcriptional regulator, AraC family [Pedobacter westerhofensis]|uniref:Transcriptional regulator, AraC family n=1 Tax=Pedobacter westerhofensis TaxID=425512 RepID=A0A521BJR3_9SPHI|nr:AraC family transcriptional regulator [Pedobacter westerhofensis]SMO47111.1 transcriptional regulator, AraC family [Pedobacter westerhofensis]
MQKTEIASYLDAIELKPKSVYVVHEKLERSLPLHSHSKSQLTYVDGGIAYIFIGEKTYFIPARHYIWIPRGLPHYVKVRTSATITRNLYFYTEDDHTNTFYSKFGIYPVNNLLFEMIGFTNKWSGYIEKKDEGYNFMAAIKNILPQMSIKSFPIALPTTTNTKLRPIVLYMAQNFGQQITLDNIATRFGMGERTLSRLFQSTMNISFLQYLKLLRIVRAIEMILQDDYTTTEIAYLTGYNSLAAFSKAFFQVTNIRPSDFNKQNRQ